MRMSVGTIRFAAIAVVLAVLPVFCFGQGAPRDDLQRTRQLKIPLNFVKADYVVEQIHALPVFRGVYQVELTAIARDNSIIATGTDESLRELKQTINLLDVVRKTISLKAEAVLVLNDKAGHKHRAVVSSNSMISGEKPVRLKSAVEGEPAVASEISMVSGLSDVNVTAQINGDASISLDGTWEFDFTFHVPGQTRPLRMHNSYAISGRARNNDTICVSGSINKTGGDKNGVEAEILLFLTPHIVPEAAGQVGRGGFQNRNTRP